ncbi:uncharacterized protein [Procambarus clarkii]|uniref:uncharacterized protein n=1 Tax=Procambarus clarkii TaxID=6728 RepID=UPI0037439E78
MRPKVAVLVLVAAVAWVAQAAVATTADDTEVPVATKADTEVPVAPEADDTEVTVATKADETNATETTEADKSETAGESPEEEETKRDKRQFFPFFYPSWEGPAPYWSDPRAFWPSRGFSGRFRGDLASAPSEPSARLPDIVDTSPNSPVSLSRPGQYAPGWNLRDFYQYYYPHRPYSFPVPYYAPRFQYGQIQSPYDCIYPFPHRHSPETSAPFQRGQLDTLGSGQAQPGPSGVNSGIQGPPLSSGFPSDFSSTQLQSQTIPGIIRDSSAAPPLPGSFQGQSPGTGFDTSSFPASGRPDPGSQFGGGGSTFATSLPGASIGGQSPPFGGGVVGAGSSAPGEVVHLVEKVVHLVEEAVHLVEMEAQLVET